MTAKNIFNKFEKTVGGLKFAVIIISLFSILMIIGTFLESYYGTDFANRILYKSIPFILLQAAMFFSILFATFLRLPPKKRLYGFYVIHSGLLIIGIGSIITYFNGIDGSINLPPNTASRHVYLPDDILRITFPKENRYVTAKLPNSALKTNINLNYGEIKATEYLPFAENKTIWKKPSSNSKYNSKVFHSGEFQIFNKNVSQNFILTLNPEAEEYSSSTNLGPLSIYYLPSLILECFKKRPPSKLIIWNADKHTCFIPKDRSVQIQKTDTNKRFFVIFNEKKKPISFFPDQSPWPLGKDFRPDRSSPYRVFSLSMFEKKPFLFILGKNISYFDKNTDVWVTKGFDKNNSVKLPWMDFTLLLLKHSKLNIPTVEPSYTIPIQKNGTLIKGQLRAIKIQIRDKNYWVTNQRSATVIIDGKKAKIELTKDNLLLPFEITLNRFQMNKNPGTNMPASYESFVTVFSKDGPQKHHIFMNNPLKMDGLTFYQASYSQDKNGNYSSTLSVNIDQGRGLKYFGSLLLVLGSIWHFYLNRRKLKTPDNQIV